MKVILADKYGREWVKDKLLMADLSTIKANKVADLYNRTHTGKNDEWIAKAVSNSYTLYNADYISMER